MPIFCRSWAHILNSQGLELKVKHCKYKQCFTNLSPADTILMNLSQCWGKKTACLLSSVTRFCQLWKPLHFCLSSIWGRRKISRRKKEKKKKGDEENWQKTKKPLQFARMNCHPHSSERVAQGRATFMFVSEVHFRSVLLFWLFNDFAEKNSSTTFWLNVYYHENSYS